MYGVGERMLLRHLLEEEGRSQSAATRELGVNRSTVHRWIGGSHPSGRPSCMMRPNDSRAVRAPTMTTPAGRPRQGLRLVEHPSAREDGAVWCAGASPAVGPLARAETETWLAIRVVKGAVNRDGARRLAQLQEVQAIVRWRRSGCRDEALSFRIPC